MSQIARTRIQNSVRLTALLGLFATFLLVAPLPPANALFLCGTSDTIHFYSDASLTHQVGQCIEYCDASESCTGQQTAFTKDVLGHCHVC